MTKGTVQHNLSTEKVSKCSSILGICKVNTEQTVRLRMYIHISNFKWVYNPSATEKVKFCDISSRKEIKKYNIQDTSVVIYIFLPTLEDLFSNPGG